MLRVGSLAPHSSHLTLPSATYHSGRWPVWPGPGLTVPGAPAGPAAEGGQGRGRGRGWLGAQGAGWAGAAGARGTRAEVGAGAGCWREPGHCLQAGERRSQSLATGTAEACTAPPAVLSPSLPLWPPEAQYRSLMDSTGRRLMAPDSLLSGSPGSAGAAPSALPMLSAGVEAKGQPVPCPQPPPVLGTPVEPEPCREDLSLVSPVLHQGRQPRLAFLWQSPAATVGKHWLCPPGPTAVIRAISGCLVAMIPEPC